MGDVCNKIVDMAESNALSFEQDITTDFIIIQSCLQDERHNELIQNTKNVTLLDDHLTFNLGDSFDCFEALQTRLEAHSKQSNVHYWLRDSRTVVGARMKTTRAIDPRLKYYNVKYACVYGGHKRSPRGQGKRNCMSMRLNCPAHITLRANRSGERLDVVSVCNHHNHPISPDIYQHLRQERRLSSEIKADVCDMLRMGVLKSRVLEYVRARCGKVLTYKDMLNMAAAAKTTACPSSQRREVLIDALKKVESENCNPALEEKQVEKIIADRKKRQCKVFKKLIPVRRKEGIKIGEHTDFHGLPDLVIKEEPTTEMTLQDTAEDEFDMHEDLIEHTDSDVVEIHYEEENPDTITHSNIMNYLYQTDCEGEPVLAILNRDDDLVTLEPSQHYLMSPETSVEDPCMDLERLADAQPISIVEDIDGLPEEARILSNSEIILEETWIPDEVQVSQQNRQLMNSSSEMVQYVEKCNRCEKMKCDLSEEVNSLREVKKELTEETDRLRRERDRLQLEVRSWKGMENVKIPRIPIVLKRNKFYFVKI